MSAQLRDAAGNCFDLADFALIGRGDGATVRLADSGISRQHATIRREGNHYWLFDLGSANGSYVNDVALGSARILHHGDRIRLADSVLIFTNSAAGDAGIENANARTTISQAIFTPFATETMTLLVADLAGFTQLSSRLGPEQIADLLREWYADCRTILQEAGATIDKFIGDCVFAYWHGGEIATRIKALRAAKGLRDAEVDATSPTRVAVRTKHGIVLDCRIGLHVGEAAVGSMGRNINTALGDAVNVAFRLEGLTRDLKRAVLASEAFLGDWAGADGHFEPCGRHALKGIAAGIDVFAPRLIS